jgi:hypothetical protein
MDVNLILLMPNAMMIGYQYYEEDDKFEYSEVNIFLFFVQIQFRWGENL